MGKFLLAKVFTPALSFISDGLSFISGAWRQLCAKQFPALADQEFIKPARAFIHPGSL